MANTNTERDYPELPEGWPARFRCDSCDGNGEVGEPVSMGYFQPPERDRCPDCDGKGWCSEEAAFSTAHMRAYVDADRKARASLSLPAAGQEPVAADALAALRGAFSPFAQEPEWTTAHSMKYPSKAAQIINAVRDLLASEPQTGAQEQSDWDIRGQLAAKLTCWHRLTGNEAEELVALAKSWRAPQPAVAAGCADALPMQPIVWAEDGCIRFKKNSIVRDLLGYSQQRGFGLTQMAAGDYTAEERMQFAQLIGYSVSGYGGLSYVSEESADKSDAIAAALPPAPSTEGEARG